MVHNAFQVDWVFIDTVIIILLFILLLGIKIFKSTHRWRLSFSNENLEYHFFQKPNDISSNHYIKTKHCSLTRNLSLYKHYGNYPLILILRTNFKKHLTKILTEGLSSYGFNVINLKLDSKPGSGSNSQNITIHEEIKTLLSSIIESFKNKRFIVNSKFILINLSKYFILNTEILTDPKKIGFILVNPRMNKYNIGCLKEILQNLTQNTQLYHIFSKRSFLILKNHDLKHFIRQFDEKFINKSNLITLEKSTKSFKYYETILLGIIIDILENKLMKSANIT
ncbi:MAG: hypothetical protein ACFFG0_16640 [Candidatus Thorarchaeota archaeon]